MGYSFSVHSDDVPEWREYDFKKARDEGDYTVGWPDSVSYEQPLTFDAKFILYTDQLPDDMQERTEILGTYSPSEARGSYVHIEIRSFTWRPLR